MLQFTRFNLQSNIKLASLKLENEVTLPYLSIPLTTVIRL